MKPQKLIALTALLAMAIALVSGSIYGYYAIAYKTNPASTTYGLYGSYENCSDGNYQNWSGSSWGGMMGPGMRGTISTTPAPQSANVAQSSVMPLAGIGYLAIITGAIAGTGGLSYLATYRKTSHGRQQLTLPQPAAIAVSEDFSQKPTTPYVSILKTLTSDERQVLNILVAHNGKFLQKYIRTETGLSRLKIHRIVSRLAERGIVILEKTGNTNQVVLSDWLQASSVQNSA